jgi:hypothetical protein
LELAGLALLGNQPQPLPDLSDLSVKSLPSALGAIVGLIFVMLVG